MQTETEKELAPVKVAIDKTASRFAVQAFATGMLSAFGHNPTIAIRDYDCEIQFNPDSVDNACVHMTVRTNAMEVVDEMKSDDRKKLEEAMYNQVLEVSRFSTATFESKQITIQKQNSNQWQARVNGELAFHGVTQNLSFDARVMYMGTMMRVAGEFPQRQSDYGIKPVSFAGGALRLKDELKFSFELVVRQQE
ncbi:MAG: YceI family protein [Candidatus Acidiferrales bacterium]